MLKLADRKKTKQNADSLLSAPRFATGSLTRASVTCFVGRPRRWVLKFTAKLDPSKLHGENRPFFRPTIFVKLLVKWLKIVPNV